MFVREDPGPLVGQFVPRGRGSPRAVQLGGARTAPTPAVVAHGLFLVVHNPTQDGPLLLADHAVAEGACDTDEVHRSALLPERNF